MFKLLISKRASNAAKKLPQNHQDAIIAALDEIVEDPYLGKPLSRELSGQFNYRVGVCRIVYKVDVKDKKILVLRIGHRGTVYA